MYMITTITVYIYKTQATLPHLKFKYYYIKNIYPRVSRFNALEQSTDICAHLITFSSRKYII